MKQKEIPISIRAYAKQVNVDEKAVRNAIDEGKIKRGYNKKIKKIIPSKATEEWGHLHEIAKPQRGISKIKAAEKIEQKKQEVNVVIKESPAKDNKKNKDSDFFEAVNYSYKDLLNAIIIYPELTYSEALRRKEILAIAGERMKLEEQQNILVRKADVEKTLFAIGDMLKKDLFNIPNRIIDDIISAPNKVEATNILAMEITAVLNKFSAHLDGN